MGKYLLENYQTLLIYLLWIIAGVYNPLFIYALIPLTIIAFLKKEMFTEILMGFILMIIMDDNLHNTLFSFSKYAKQIYLIVLSLYVFANLRKFQPISRIFTWFLPFFVWALIALLFNSPVFFEGLEKTISYMLMLFIIPNYFIFLLRENGEKFLKDVIYFLMMILVVGLVYWWVDPSFVSVKGRFTGLLGNPNGLGIFCMMIFTLFELIKDYFPKLFSRNDKILIYILIFGCMIMSASRTAYLACAIFFLFRTFHKMSPFVSFSMLLGIIVSYEIIFLNLLDIIRFFGLEGYFRLWTLEAGAGRTIAWKFAWDEIQNNFFVGRGFHYDVYYFRSNYGILTKMGHQGLAHNSYLSIWLNAGLVGILLYLTGFFTLFFRASKRSFLSIPILYSIIVTSFAEGWLSGSLNPITIFFWIILTVLTSDQFYEAKQKVTVPLQ